MNIARKCAYSSGIFMEGRTFWRAICDTKVLFSSWDATVNILHIQFTGRFIMCSVITNIYNKKNQKTYLNGIFHSHRKTEKFFFWRLEMFDVCPTGDTAHIDTAFKFFPHTRATTWVHWYSSLLQWSVPLGQRDHVAMVLCVLCTKCMLCSNHRLNRMIFQQTNDFYPGAAILTLHKLAPRSGRNVNYDEKQLNEKKIFWIVPSVCTDFVNNCRTVFL